jgi:CYTH domain-containing protein
MYQEVLLSARINKGRENSPHQGHVWSVDEIGAHYDQGAELFG